MLMLGLSLSLGNLAFAADRSSIAVIVRAKGTAGEQAQAYISHVAHDFFVEASRFAPINLGAKLGSPEHSRAELAFDVAEEMQDNGRQAFDELELDAALEYLKIAISKYEHHAAFLDNVNPYVDALMLLAATHILRGEDRAGIEQLSKAILIHPKVQPDPRIFNPSMRLAFRQAQKSEAKRTKTDVTLSSNPSHTRVYLDGHFVGVSPVSIQHVREGSHLVQWSKEGFQRSGQLIEVSRTNTSFVQTLNRTTNFLDFESLAEAALPSVPEKEIGDSVGEAFLKLGVLLDADQILFVHVEVAAERVQVHACLIGVSQKIVLGASKRTFPHTDKLAVYQDEIKTLLDALIRGGGKAVAHTKALHANTETSLKQSSALCHGMECGSFKNLVLGVVGGSGGLMTLMGVVFQYLSKRDNDAYRGTEQVSPKAQDLRISGEKKALAGDILLGLGVSALATTIVLHLVWHPSPSVESAIEQSSSPLGIHVLPEQHGMHVVGSIHF